MGIRVLSLLLTLMVSAVLAAPALAKRSDNGEGLLGETNDKIVTTFSLVVMIFFILVVIVGSAIQNRLEKRHERQEEEASLRQRIGA